jgi:hypothetical protein
MGLFRRRASHLPVDHIGHPPARMGPGPGRRRFGLWGPIPYFSHRTRRGTEVSVGGCGCCLPIPLLVAAGTAGGVWALWRRVR